MLNHQWVKLGTLFLDKNILSNGFIVGWFCVCWDCIHSMLSVSAWYMLIYADITNHTLPSPLSTGVSGSRITCLPSGSWHSYPPWLQQSVNLPEGIWQVLKMQTSGLCSTTCCHLANLGNQKTDHWKTWKLPCLLSLLDSLCMACWYLWGILGPMNWVSEKGIHQSHPVLREFHQCLLRSDKEHVECSCNACPGIVGCTTILRTAWPANFVQLSAVRLESGLFNFITCQCWAWWVSDSPYWHIMGVLLKLHTWKRYEEISCVLSVCAPLHLMPVIGQLLDYQGLPLCMAQTKAGGPQQPIRLQLINQKQSQPHVHVAKNEPEWKPWQIIWAIPYHPPKKYGQVK